MRFFLTASIVLALLVAACVAPQPKPVAKVAAPKPPVAVAVPKPLAISGADPRFLVRKPEFTTCEVEAFVAVGIARNAIVLKETQASMLAVKTNGPLQVAMINEVFERMKTQNLRDHGLFAAEKFYQCTQRQKLPVSRNLNGASVCLARQDILFYLNASRLKGQTEADAVFRVKGQFEKSSQAIYPDSLIDQLAPMAYRAISDNGAFELRRFAFETCLFPKDWTAWYNSMQPAPAK